MRRKLPARYRSLIVTKAAAANVSYNIDIPEELGNIEIDTSSMSAALVNFLENAVDACEPPLPDKEYSINISAREVADQIEIKISDNGSGMDQETREKIFTLFFSSKGKRGLESVCSFPTRQLSSTAAK